MILNLVKELEPALEEKRSMKTCHSGDKFPTPQWGNNFGLSCWIIPFGIMTQMAVSPHKHKLPAGKVLSDADAAKMEEPIETYMASTPPLIVPCVCN
jgi:hypothetical protein